MPRFCQNFKPFWHYLASQQSLTGTFIRYLCTAHIEVFDNDSSPAIDHFSMNTWSIRHLPTLPAVICTFTALDLDMYASNFTVRQDHANLLTPYLQHNVRFKPIKHFQKCYIYVHLDFRHISPRQRSSIWWSAIFLHAITHAYFWILYVYTNSYLQ